MICPIGDQTTANLTPAMPTSSPLLQITSLSKSYPGVVANSNVSLCLEQGKIHALLGENGAGKSTLVKIIYGLVKPDQGKMQWRGERFAPLSPRQARQAGIAMVFQHFNVFEAMNVAENIALGMEDPLPSRQLAKQIETLSHSYDLPLDPQRRVGDLSAGERQRVEIIRCLLQHPRLLIMDEPTSVLTPQEVESLFRTLRQLAAEGTAILYISHKLREIRRLCDWATVLRRGKVHSECDPSAHSVEELAKMMVGTSVPALQRSDKVTESTVMLELNGLNLAAQSEFGTRLQDVNLTLHAGEILGIAGVAGNGQDELFSVLSGECLSQAQQVRYRQQSIGKWDIGQRRAQGLWCCPEKRLGHAAVADLSLCKNAYLSGHARGDWQWAGCIRWSTVAQYAQQIVTDFDVRTPGIETAAGALSGGNLQKFVIGREVMQSPVVLVVNQPTWGVDAAAAIFIRQRLMELAKKGAAIIVISQDLDELMEMTDRIAALNAGRLSEIRPTSGIKIEQIGLMMGGAVEEEGVSQRA